MAKRTKTRKVKRAARKTSRKARRATKVSKVARRSQARPERGKIHYLLRNIPKATWKRFLASREDARFDLLTYINSEAAKVAEAPEPEKELPAGGAEQEPAAPETIRIEPTGIESEEVVHAPEEAPTAVNE